MNTAREPQGIPAGGQFAAINRAEGKVTISTRKPFEETLRAHRGHDFFPPDVASWPGLYETEDSGELADKRFQARYFIGRAEWLVAEIDQKTGAAFGYADLGQGHGEFGYIDLKELEGIQVGPLRQPIERDLDFVPGTLAKDCIEKYREDETDGGESSS